MGTTTKPTSWVWVLAWVAKVQPTPTPTGTHTHNPHGYAIPMQMPKNHCLKGTHRFHNGTKPSNTCVYFSAPTMCTCPSSSAWSAPCMLQRVSGTGFRLLDQPWSATIVCEESVLIHSHQQAKTSWKMVGAACASCWVNTVRVRMWRELNASVACIAAVFQAIAAAAGLGGGILRPTLSDTTFVVPVPK